MQQDHKEEITLSSHNVCCIADLHIGVHQNSIHWHETALQWAKWLSQELSKQKVKDIFILGDVFHYRDEIAVNTLHTVNEIFKLWDNFNIIILVGNHDAFYKDRSDINSVSVFDKRKNVKVISKIEEYTFYGKKCAFIPWGESVNNLNNKDIVFGHFEIESFKMNSYKLCDKGLKTSELLDKTNLVISGHFHLREERDYSGKKIIYVGNPFEMDFGDVNSTKGYYILDFNNLSFSFNENSLSPKHKKVFFSELINFKKIKNNSFDDIIKNNIIKLIVDKPISADDVDLILKKITSHKPFSVSIEYTVNNNLINEDVTNVDMSGIDIEKAIEEFINMLDIQDKQDIISFCRDLYKKCK